MNIDPALADFLIFLAWYGGIGLGVHLLYRFTEVLEVLNYCDRHNYKFRAADVKEAWGLDRQYDSGMHGYVLCFLVWPMGIVYMLIAHANVWFWLFMVPFRSMSIRIIPKWMTLTNILDKINARRGENLY